MSTTSDKIVEDTEGRVVVVPIDYRVVASGDVVPVRDGEWINLHLHDDGTVTWFPHPTEEPQ